MAEHVVPHFHNDIGAAVIEIGAKEFMCIGATPPFDHPHVFCDMGDDNEFICSYCSTLYRYDPKLHGYEARPGRMRVAGARDGVRRLQGNGLKIATPKCLKSRTLRVTTVKLRTSAVAAIIASSLY